MLAILNALRYRAGLPLLHGDTNWRWTMLELKLRNYRETDFEAVHAAHSDYNHVKMTLSWPWPPDPEFTRMRINKNMAAMGQAQVIDLNGQFIGGIALIRGWLAYGVVNEYRGQGVASWAIGLKVSTAFLTTDLKMMEASVWHDNPASMAVLRKNGFVLTGEIREFCKARGKDMDGFSFRVNRAEPSIN